MTIPTGQGTCEIQFLFHCPHGIHPEHYPELNCLTCDAGFSYFRKDKDALGHMFNRGYFGYNTPVVTPSLTNPANALRVLAPYVNNALDHRRAMVTHYTIRDLSLDYDEKRGEVRYFEDINIPIGTAGHTYQIRFYNPYAGGAGYLYIEFQGGRTDVYKWGVLQASTGSAT
ncbi:MAG: hypothetical protein IJC16_00345 [Rikenellaceae bacterium]|nr:hypothetical protein [Rikenellaceae bacterium]